MVSWEEYHSYFLHKNGLSRNYINKHSEKHRELSRSMKETIMRDRAAWSEAARTDPDHLTLDEFLAFRHPESSHATILSLVEELFDKFGKIISFSKISMTKQNQTKLFHFRSRRRRNFDRR